MRFDNFPLELKRKIFSYFLPHELREKVSSVSKEWDLIARDTFIWRNVEFFGDRDSFQIVVNFLQGSRVENITFHNYAFCNSVLSTFPILNSVKEVKFDYCTFYDSDILRMFVHCFPNTCKLSVNNQPEYMLTMDGLKSDVKYLQQWKNLKSVELNELMDMPRYNGIVRDLTEQKHHLTELIILRGEVICRIFVEMIDRYGQHLETFAFHFYNYPTREYRKLTFCPNLRRLSLLSPHYLANNEFILITRELRQLTYLHVNYALKLFSPGFGELFKDVTLHQLQELVLGRCSKLNDDNLTLIVKSSPLLKHLTLQRLKEITDKGLEPLPDVARKLKILHLECMRRVTKRCLIKINRELPSLCEIVAKNCRKVAPKQTFTILKIDLLTETESDTPSISKIIRRCIILIALLVVLNNFWRL